MITEKRLNELEKLAIQKRSAEYPRQVNIDPTELLRLIHIAKAALKTGLLETCP